MLEAEVPSIAQKAQEVACILSSRHQEDIGYSGIDQGLDGVKNHGAVIHGKKVLVCNPREREQSRTDPARQYDAFHVVTLRGGAAEMVALDPMPSTIAKSKALAGICKLKSMVE